MKLSMTIQYDTDSVFIYDHLDNEVVMWTQQEWVDEPEIVPAIAHACYLAASNPQLLLSLLKKHYEDGVLVLDKLVVSHG